VHQCGYALLSGYNVNIMLHNANHEVDANTMVPPTSLGTEGLSTQQACRRQGVQLASPEHRIQGDGAGEADSDA
jgi:hypothetical protein